MTLELAMTLGMLGMVIVMFIIDRPRMDGVALIVICALPLTGIISIDEALAGFADPNVVLIAVLFVLGDGLVRTGVASAIGDWIVRTAGHSQMRLNALLMASVCLLGSTMSSTAVTAIFVPVVLRVCQRTGNSPGKLMMPLSMAALISGMMTLVATAPNLVIHAELIKRGHQGFGFFSFTPVGVPILIVAILYMKFASKWLPDGNSGDRTRKSRRATLAQWVELYQLVDREYRLRVGFGSSLVGKSLETLSLRQTLGASLVAIQRGPILIQPRKETKLEQGDILLVDFFGEKPEIKSFIERYDLEQLPLTGAHFTDRSQEIGMVEAFVTADSEFVGKSITDISFRTRFGMSMIGLRRGLHPLASSLRNEKLRVGDTLLLIGPWKAIRLLQERGGSDLVPLNLPVEYDHAIPARGKMPQALFCLGFVVLAMVSGLLPNVQAAFIGCLLMGSFRCISFDSAYRAIDWKTIVLIVGMLPFSLALERTGGIDLLSSALIHATRGLGTSGVLTALFLVTAIISLFVSNTATAVLMGPVAISIAEHIRESPGRYAMIIALAASASFSTPVSTPVNTLVVTPGGYRFGDFVRIGIPFTIIVMIVSVILVGSVIPI
jgi:di/tricarboxylate transporter